jgi:hypothetical protein
MSQVRQQLLIGGEWMDAASGETFEVTDPWTGAPATVAAAAARPPGRQRRHAGRLGVGPDTGGRATRAAGPT